MEKARAKIKLCPLAYGIILSPVFIFFYYLLTLSLNASNIFNVMILEAFWKYMIGTIVGQVLGLQGIYRYKKSREIESKKENQFDEMQENLEQAMMEIEDYAIVLMDELAQGKKAHE